MTIGERLTLLRNKIGYSQEQMAQQLGVKRSTYAKWEKNANKPSRQIDKLATFFKVSTDYILCRTDDPTPRDSAASRQPAAHSGSDAPSTPRLSEREQVHIRYYRTLTEAHKDDVDDMTKRWSAQDNEKGTVAHTKDGDGMTTAEESSQHTAS